MLGGMLMANDRPPRVEVITGVAGRRYWPAHEKLRIVEDSLVPGEFVLRSPGVTASLRTCCFGGVA